MNLRFCETLEGEFVPSTGEAPRPAKLRAHVDTPPLTSALRGVSMPLKAWLVLGQDTDACACEGHITLDLQGTQRIVYELQWRQNAALYRFYAFKHLDLLTPIQSLTTLRGKVITEGELCGTLQLRSTLSHALACLASVRVR